MLCRCFYLYTVPSLNSSVCFCAKSSYRIISHSLTLSSCPTKATPVRKKERKKKTHLYRTFLFEFFVIDFSASASATASATARACAASRGKRKRKETAGGFPQSIPRHRHPTVYPRCARYHHSSLRRRRRRRRAFLLRTRVFFSRFFARPRPLEELLPHPSASKARCCRCSASSSLSHAAQPVFPCCFFVCQYRSKHHTKHNRGQNRDTRQSRE